MREKLQKIIRERMNSSKMSTKMKFKQGLKKLKRIEKSPKEYFGISQLFEKQALEELITSSNCFFYFSRQISSVVGLFIGLFDKRVGFRQFLVKRNSEGSVGSS